MNKWHTHTHMRTHIHTYTHTHTDTLQVREQSIYCVHIAVEMAPIAKVCVCVFCTHILLLYLCVVYVWRVFCVPIRFLRMCVCVCFACVCLCVHVYVCVCMRMFVCACVLSKCSANRGVSHCACVHVCQRACVHFFPCVSVQVLCLLCFYLCMRQQLSAFALQMVLCKRACFFSYGQMMLCKQGG